MAGDRRCPDRLGGRGNGRDAGKAEAAPLRGWIFRRRRRLTGAGGRGARRPGGRLGRRIDLERLPRPQGPDLPGEGEARRRADRQVVGLRWGLMPCVHRKKMELKLYLLNFNIHIFFSFSAL